MKNKIVDPQFLYKNREIVRTAQKLVNEEFDKNCASLIDGKKHEHKLDHKLEKFERSIKASLIFSDEEKNTFSQLDKTSKIQLARDIVLSLLNKEINSPVKKE